MHMKLKVPPTRTLYVSTPQRPLLLKPTNRELYTLRLDATSTRHLENAITVSVTYNMVSKQRVALSIRNLLTEWR